MKFVLVLILLFFLFFLYSSLEFDQFFGSKTPYRVFDSISNLTKEPDGCSLTHINLLMRYK